MSSNQPVSLTQAVAAYLASLSEKQRPEAGRELARFVRWYGGDRPLQTLSPAEIDRYQAYPAQSGADPARFRPLRPFLAYLEKQNLTEHSLAAALRTRRGTGKPKAAAPRRRAAPPPARDAAPPSTQAPQPPNATKRPGAASGDLRCSVCGEEEALRGGRQADAIVVTCQRCGHSWNRDPRPTCRTCGRTDLIKVREPILEKVRGNQISIVGTRMVQRCPVCDA